MDINLGLLFLIALFLTIASETLILLFLTKFFLPKTKRPKWKDILLAGIISSSLTLPYLWFVFPTLFNYYTSLIVGETLIVFVEALIIQKFLTLSLKKALVFSFITNLASFLLGKIIF